MENTRTALSKRQRFDVFKRDEFTCQYCGRKPPDVILEVDHVVAVASGGSNEEHNLLTSCFDCNRGKGRRPIDVTPVNVEEKRRLIEERRDQVREYEAILQQIREENEAKIDAVIAVFEYHFEGPIPIDFSRSSIRNFLNHLPLQVLQEAMEIACDTLPSRKVFRYFCGICWRRIKGINDGVGG